MGSVVFRRIKGKIIPIRQAGEKIATGRVGRRLATSAAVSAAPIAGAAAAIRAKPTIKKTSSPNKFYLAAGYGLQVASGIVSGIPTSGTKGFLKGFLASTAIDAASTAAFAKSVQGLRGDRKTKLKAFAKHQAIGSAIGYGVFGATLLRNPRTIEVLKKVISYAK